MVYSKSETNFSKHLPITVKEKWESKRYISYLEKGSASALDWTPFAAASKFSARSLNTDSFRKIKKQKCEILTKSEECTTNTMISAVMRDVFIKQIMKYKHLQKTTKRTCFRQPCRAARYSPSCVDSPPYCDSPPCRTSLSVETVHEIKKKGEVKELYTSVSKTFSATCDTPQLPRPKNNTRHSITKKKITNTAKIQIRTSSANRRCTASMVFCTTSNASKSLFSRASACLFCKLSSAVLRVNL